MTNGLNQFVLVPSPLRLTDLTENIFHYSCDIVHSRSHRGGPRRKHSFRQLFYCFVNNYCYDVASRLPLFHPSLLCRYLVIAVSSIPHLTISWSLDRIFSWKSEASVSNEAQCLYSIAVNLVDATVPKARWNFNEKLLRHRSELVSSTWPILMHHNTWGTYWGHAQCTLRTFSTLLFNGALNIDATWVSGHELETSRKEATLFIRIY
jgi:hypothetical protein